MSQYSQSSSNYQQLVQNFLDRKYQKQWQLVPQIVYMTIKALFNHTSVIQQNLYQQRQLFSEQSIKIKQLSLQIQDLVSKNQLLRSQQVSQFNSKHKENGFRKNKKPFQSGLFSRPQSNKKNRGNETFSNIKQQSYKSVAGDKNINSLAIQQIKTLVGQLVQQKNKQKYQKFQKIEISNVQNAKKLHQNISKTMKEMSLFREQLSNHLNNKIRELQSQLNRKYQSQRLNILNFIQGNAVQMQKIWAEVNNTHIRVQGLLLQKQKSCSDHSALTNKQLKHYKTKKNNQNQEKFLNQTKEEQKTNSQLKVYDLFTSLNRQFIEFKLKTGRQMTSFIRTETIEQIINKYQSQIVQKISKISKNVQNIQKQIDNQKRQKQKQGGLIKNQSKSKINFTLNSLNVSKSEEKQQSRRDRKSDQNLKIIHDTLEKLENHFGEKLKLIKKQYQSLIQNLQLGFEKEVSNLKKELHKQLQFRQKTMCQLVQKSCDDLTHIKQKLNSSNQTSLLKILQKLSEQMILTRYLHVGERQCQDVIQWQKNVYNAMQENYIWKKASHFITVVAAGLYRLQVGIYPDNQVDKIQAFIMLNGTPISGFTNKQVPQYSQAPSRGFLFNEPVLLPSKSKIWVKIQKSFYGQAFLQILKL